MTRPPQNAAAAAAAGGLAVAVLIAGAAVGYGLGSLVGLQILFGALGLLAGFILGIAVVYVRFRGS
jgi:uncharacterized membrane protein required for colicin V production